MKASFLPRPVQRTRPPPQLKPTVETTSNRVDPDSRLDYKYTAFPQAPESMLAQDLEEFYRTK